MKLFGADLGAQDLVKILPALFGVLAAAVRVLPNLVSAARERESHPPARGASPLRIASYSGSSPFSAVFPLRYEGAPPTPGAAAARCAMHERTLRWCRWGGLAATLLLAAYLAYGAPQDRLPGWSLLLAIAVWAMVGGTLARTYGVVRADPERGSAATPQCGELVVEGDGAEVRQHGLAALVDLGARIVSVDDTRILAATGVSFGRDRWMGEVIWVRFTDVAPGRVEVSITSTKADFATRSRSWHNVAAFLESFASWPAAASTRDDR